jgi:RimJ/RimL family protein N-acetyltransferase
MRDVLRIETERLTLRPLERGDCTRVAQFLADTDVARMTSSVPAPYPPVAAEGWLMLMRARAPLGEEFVFAIDLEGESEGLIGCIGVHKRGARTIVGYWIGKPFWGRGFASEALIAFVEEAQALGELEADHFVDNPASGRVLEKAGFIATGVVEPGFSIARGASAPLRAMKRAPRRSPRVRDEAEACAC